MKILRKKPIKNIDIKTYSGSIITTKLPKYMGTNFIGAPFKKQYKKGNTEEF